ncbi:MAG: hypothetical protein MHM6MM_006365 [Cercozoa sp. M6MM]
MAGHGPPTREWGALYPFALYALWKAPFQMLSSWRLKTFGVPEYEVRAMAIQSYLQEQRDAALAAEKK